MPFGSLEYMCRACFGVLIRKTFHQSDELWESVFSSKREQPCFCLAFAFGLVTRLSSLREIQY